MNIFVGMESLRVFKYRDTTIYRFCDFSNTRCETPYSFSLLDEMVTFFAKLRSLDYKGNNPDGSLLANQINNAFLRRF